MSRYRTGKETREDAKDEFYVMDRLRALFGSGSSLSQMQQHTFGSLATRWGSNSRRLLIARFERSPYVPKEILSSEREEVTTTRG